MGGIGLVLLFSLALLLIVSIDTTYAIPYPTQTNTIGIQLSQTCFTMVKHNVTSDCPTYRDLVDLGWDDSLPGSGEFFVDDFGMYRRGPAEYTSVHELYRYDDYHIIIDPPTEIATRTNLIIISPSLPIFVPLGGYEKVLNQRILQQDRYVDDCQEATITAANWRELISDTVYFLRNNCTHTNYPTEVIVTDYASSMDITTSAKYKHEKWLAESKEKCKGICKEY